ncbi:MAG: hypothetical protein KDC53_13680, partial [Saprospiraceae bacterium]|nr:hypothetical protein [Saprospiraceae bacterium]
YMLTGDSKYKEWLLDYVDAWLERMEANDGIIPTNVGLDGRIGGAADGKWYGGVYGWGFSPVVPQTGIRADRNRVERGQVGFINALLLTGDRKYMTAWGNMLDQVNSHSRQIEGKTQYPRMYGDNGWYAFQPTPWSSGALECYFFTYDPQDKARVHNNEWITFLDGEDEDYPERSMKADFARIRDKIEAMHQDQTTPDTRLADDPMEFNPATVGTLRQLMMAGLDPGRGGALLHCRLRYFDTINHRAGIPQDVGALIDEMTADHVAVTLVNLDQIHGKELIVQTGAYAEHQCSSVEINGQHFSVDQPHFTVRLSPGAGARLIIRNRRFVNDPTILFPWDQSSNIRK